MSNRFVLYMVKGHHLQLCKQPPLFRDFKWFNFKAPGMHCPMIQEEVQEVLARGPLNHSLVVLVFIILCL